MSIVDAQGAVVASYEYDPYGNLISDEPAENTVGHLNPIRYRGYYYDSESELYYLQSRYYDPEIGRFLNADAFASTGQGVLGNNMFAYCLNHPITMVDYHGHDAIYVVDTSAEQGLPVVGHAIVYIQDSAGNWYMTEYSGVFSDKTTARIRFVSASTEEVEKIIQGEAGKNIQYMYISGDFSESVAIAQTYMGTDFSGYNLLFNNCADYAQMVLLEGSFDDRFERLAISTTGSPIPVDLLRSIAEAKMFSAIWGGITDGIERLWEAVTK